MKIATWQKALGLYVLAGLARLLFALQLSFPPLDDPAYYIQSARNLVKGNGLDISIIWNFNPLFEKVTHPGLEFWQPLTALAMAFSLFIFGDNYFAMQLPNVLAGATLPVYAYFFARRVLPKTLPVEALALVAAFFTLFNPLMLYQSGLPTTSMLYAALVGGAVLLLTPDLSRVQPSPTAENEKLAQDQASGLSQDRACSYRWGFGVGLLIGLAYLTRTPAIFLGLTWLIVMIAKWFRGERKGWVGAFGMTILGIIIPVGIWSLRNLFTFGFISSPSAFQAIFLPDYETLFNFRQQASLQTWGEVGIGTVIGVRLEALGTAITTLNAMLPPNAIFAAIGLGVLAWKVSSARSAALYCLILFLGLPLIFGVVSTNGTYYQSVGSCAPFFIVGLIYGLWAGGQTLVKRLNRPHLQLGGLFISLFLLINFVWLIFTYQAVVENDRGLADQYGRLKIWLQANPAQVVIASQPSSVNYVANVAAVRLPPKEDLNTLLEIARKYKAEYIIITEAAGLYPNILISPANQIFSKIYQDAKGDIIIFSVPK
jgi:4-amino-4-deoxy-L-arabinose transferase-like glycosyltransferase